jgi:hypothetical protein
MADFGRMYVRGMLAWFSLKTFKASERRDEVKISGAKHWLFAKKNLAATHRSLWQGSRPRPATGEFFLYV